MNYRVQRSMHGFSRCLLLPKRSILGKVQSLSCTYYLDQSHLFSTLSSHDFQFQLNYFINPNNCLVPKTWLKYCSTGCQNSPEWFVQRSYSSQRQKSEASKDKSLVEARESPYAHLTLGQKVKEAGKDVSYSLVIVAGLAVTGVMFYMIGRELLSSQSPSGIYADALKKCQNSIEVTAALGEPIKGYGETTRRGRRRMVSHTDFDVNGVPHMRVRFYIEGPHRKATVYTEVQKDESGKFQYRLLAVETEGYPHRMFILEDNRRSLGSPQPIKDIV